MIGNTNFPDLTGCVEIMKFQNNADTWEEGLILMSTRNPDNENEYERVGVVAYVSSANTKPWKTGESWFTNLEARFVTIV